MVFHPDWMFFARERIIWKRQCMTNSLIWTDLWGGEGEGRGKGEREQRGKKKEKRKINK